ncbi:hypothetical protein [Paenibacillus sp. FJAT-26967]|uniref:hypothetical protein n=1 Tax=Paenibacillus sp. FJAT-26967 TaxID=1729690 RepID=UPI000838CC95|nr:hypothetical protein [Paenibacillus sp. FJAT-26967]
MSRFKDRMAADIRVFMNQDEFAEVHVLDDRALWMIVENDARDGKPLPYAEGVSLHQKTIHVDLIELKYIPPVGQTGNFDGLPYVVTAVSVEATERDLQGVPVAGIIKIILETNVDD